MSFIKNATRTAKASASVKTVTVQNIVEELGVVDVRMVTWNKTGKEYMHFIAADGSYLSVGLGETVDLQSKGYAERMRELLTYTIYTGDTLKDGTKLDNHWFSFGKAAEMKETETVSISSIFSLSGSKKQLEDGVPA